MRTSKWNAIGMAVTLAFAGRALAQEPAEHHLVESKSMKSMSVAELDKAGDACRARKDNEDAVQYFQEAVRRESKDAVLRNKLGMAKLGAGLTGQARMDFERAAKLNPKYPDALNNVGAVYFIQHKPGPAAKYFKKAVALDETRAVFHMNLGSAWFDQRKFEPAMNEYARALELDPQVIEQHGKGGLVAQITNPEERAKYFYVLAKIYAKRGDLDSCLLSLRKAKENNYRDLANVYKEEEFSRLWNDPRLAEVVPPPVKKS